MTKESGEAAISAMNGTELKGREMKVGTATPRVRAGCWSAEETAGLLITQSVPVGAGWYCFSSFLSELVMACDDVSSDSTQF